MGSKTGKRLPPDRLYLTEQEWSERLPDRIATGNRDPEQDLEHDGG